ncbi:MAG: hypothetical protein QGG83_00530 [Candidatus Woesearchaeota archaeon]|nr:hypothetical protein [Candidatus Woesearchaeota archaeon]
MTIIQTVRNAAIAATMALPVFGDGLTIGKKGPTNLQLQNVTTHNVEKKSTSTNTAIKYWDKNKWAIVSQPYVWTKDKEGTGDLTILGGPRGDHGTLHYNSFAGMTVPTGKIGSDKPTVRAGVLATKTFLDNKCEVDVALQGNFPLDNAPNSYKTSIVVGGNLSKTWKAGVGYRNIHVNGENKGTAIGVVRKLFPNVKGKPHAEFRVNQGIYGGSIAQMLLRWNF